MSLWCGALLGLTGAVRAQDAAPVAPAVAPALQAEAAPVTPVPRVPTAAAPAHRFWDRKNALLFSGVGASRFLDMASTLNFRRRGVNEAFLNNKIVDNHPAFAAIELAGTGASIGVSYLFHRTGHHRIERWTSYVHIGVAGGGAIRNYSLKTVHAAAPSSPGP